MSKTSQAQIQPMKTHTSAKLAPTSRPQGRTGKCKYLHLSAISAISLLALSASPLFAQDAGASTSVGAGVGAGVGAALGDTTATAAGASALAGVTTPEVPTGLLPADPQATPPPPPDPTPGLGDARLAESENAPPTGLIEAISLALRDNPSRKESRFALEAARARIGTARSAGGPQVSASGNVSGQRGLLGGGSSGNFNTGGTGTGGTGTGGTGTGGTGTGNNGGGNNGDNILGFSTNTSLGVSASVPLYNGGRVKAATRVADANARAQASRVLQLDQELVLQVSLAYLDVLRAEQLLRVADSNLAVSRERRRVAGVRFDAGAAARLEVLRADTTLADAQQRRVIAVNSLGQSKAAINTLLGRAPETPFRPQSLVSLALQFGAALPPGAAFGLSPSGALSPSGIAGISVPGATAPVAGTTGVSPTTGATTTSPATNNPAIVVPNAIPGTNIGGAGATGAGAVGTGGATAPNVTAPGVDLPSTAGGNAGTTTGATIGTGATAPGVSVPGVTAPGAGGTTIGGAPGTTSSGTVLTNPAGTGVGGIGSGTGIGVGGIGVGVGASTSDASGASSAANLTQQSGILAGQSGANLRTSAGAGRQSLAVTQAQIEAAEAAVDVARAQKKPNIDLSLSGFLRQPASFLGRFLLGVGVGIAQNVFDSGRTRSQVREAQATVNQLRQGFAGQQLQVAQQIEQSLLSFDSAGRRQVSADVAVTASVEALRAAQLGYEAGARTNLEVSDAQTALLAAQIDSINTRFDIAQAQASLAASVGVFSPEAREAMRRALDEETTRINATPVGAGEQPKKKRRKILGIF